MPNLKDSFTFHGYYVCSILLVIYIYPSEYENDLLLCKILHNITEEKKLAFRLFSTIHYIKPEYQEGDPGGDAFGVQ